MPVERDDVLACYRDGVKAIQRYASRMTDTTWDTIACGEWTAAQVVAHVRIVIGWYHGWLDRAEAGDGTPAWVAGELDERNARELAQLAPASPNVHMEAFAASAEVYAERLVPSWDLPFGYPRGTVTAGQHAALAALEWHTHAWDLGRVLGDDHDPQRSGLRAEAATETWLASQARPRRSTAAGVPADPWLALLRRLGRV
jgi:hypothetical protein